MNLNKAFILGRLTADPQLRTTPGGMSVMAIGVATNRVWTDKAGAKQNETEFHNVVIWGRQAEVVSQFLVKGSLLLVEGRIQTRSWQGKDGQSRKTTEIIAEQIQLGPRPMGAGGQGGGGFGPSTGSGYSSGARAPQAANPTGAQQSPKDPPAQDTQLEDIPVINVDEAGAEEIRPEDLPF